MSKNNTPRLWESFVKVDENERAVKYSRIEDDVRDLSGRLLTILDASFVNESQNKAVKDLVKTQIREFLLRYQSYCLNKEGHSVSHLI